MEFILEPYNQGVGNEELLADLKRTARRLKTKTLTRDVYESSGKYSAGTFAMRFGSWSAAVELAGLVPSQRKNATVEELFANLEKIWRKKGSQPYPSDMTRQTSRYCINTYLRVFGSWRKALKAFAAYINSGRDLNAWRAKKNIPAPVKKRMRKNVTSRTRWKILERDNFTCQGCGRSPATHHGLILHVDHIKPKSKKGSNSAANLRALCEDCNRGKGNLEPITN